MRTTLTLDDDVAIRLEGLRRARSLTFKEVVNQLLRQALSAVDQPKPSKKRYVTQVYDLGPSLIGNLDNIAEVLAIAEGEDYR